MSKFFSKFTSQKTLKIETQLHKITSTSESVMPSLNDLHQIAIATYDSSKASTISRILAMNLQVIKADSVKQLHKLLMKISKTLIILQYLVQVGSEEFVYKWQRDAKVQKKQDEKESNFEILIDLFDNLTQIENSNLCQESAYSNSTFASGSKKESIRNSLSASINKLAKLINYLRDPEDLGEFRDSFQKLRDDMSKPTPRASIDSRVRPSIEYRVRPSIDSMTVPYSTEYHNRNDILNQVLNKSKSFDLNRGGLGKNQYVLHQSREHHENDLKQFSKEFKFDKSRLRVSSDSKILSPLIEVNEQPSTLI